MEINKEELRTRFQCQDWNYVFDKAYKISDYLCCKVYKMAERHDKEDIVQECLLNLHKKIIQNKVDENNNIFSFIYTNSNYRILEILRKERNRAKKATFVSIDGMVNGRNFVGAIGSRPIFENEN